MRASLYLVPALLVGSASAQTFVNTPSQIPSGAPFNNSSTENVDFGDIDLDGDWDAIFADGGDDGNDQNRIWINEGGLQGGTIGFFTDETAARFPVVQDDSRDIEFVDHDADGDLDIYISNTAQLSNQGNLWWDNDGFEQGGTLGFYSDNTGARWVNLGGAGSSIANSLIFNDTFIDWSCDCDFGDMDNDGDMDLAHSSYGGAFGGAAPTRLFLNDGDGHFEEFNPSGFQLGTANISNGVPALWAEGTQQANTSNTTGAQADVASSALDIDLGDIDGDFDLDLLHGARQELPRMFQNRYEEKGGQLGWRDITNFSFPSGYSTGDGHYEQEMDDLDGDGDLDLYGLNWQTGTFTGFNDIVAENTGDGSYTNLVALSGSGDDDNEGDFIDYDNDGDLDLFVANFSGQNRMYRNNNNGGGPGFTYTNVTNTVLAGDPNCTSLDADIADLDNDGDYDYIDACDNFAANKLMLNVSQIPDTTAPWLPHLEAHGNTVASADALPVRVQVYDNSPYYITWYNPTVLERTVDGIELSDQKMDTMGGQIFRAELAGNFVGSVEYTATSEDEYGNSGSSASESFVGSGPTGTDYGTGSLGTQGAVTLRSLNSPFGGAPLVLVLENMTPGAAAIIGYSRGAIAPTDLGDGLILNMNPVQTTVINGIADANGRMIVELANISPLASGITMYAQGAAVDGVGGATWASSEGLQLDIQ